MVTDEKRKEPMVKQRSSCPVAIAMDILGDKWTLLVIRDMIYGKARYGEFLQSPEKIPTNILADRLNRLVSYGVVEKRMYSEKPKRYEYHLSQMGIDLAQVVKVIYDWSMKYFDGKPQMKAKPGSLAALAGVDAD